jgi:hypothetical protein
LNHWQPETANPRGAITFGAGSTYNPSADTQKRGAGNSYAAAPARPGFFLLKVHPVFRNED